MIMSILKLIWPQRRTAESPVFFLHYRITVWILLSMSTVLLFQEFSENKIQCLSPFLNGGTDSSSLNDYCWNQPTFIDPPSSMKQAGPSVPTISEENIDVSEMLFQHKSVYQWIWIILLLQAFLFGLPYMMWKSLEPGFLATAIEGLTNCNQDIEDQSFEIKIKSLVSFLIKNWGNFSLHAGLYIMCEVIATANIFMQVCMIDFLLVGRFVSYKFLLGIDISAAMDSLYLLFPLHALCNLSPPNDADVLYATCMYRFSSVNRTLVFCFWIWCMVLLHLTYCHLIYSLLCIIYANLRLIPEKIANFVDKKPVLNKCYPKLARFSYGDWFVLNIFKRNLDEKSFRFLTSELLSGLHEKQ